MTRVGRGETVGVDVPLAPMDGRWVVDEAGVIVREGEGEALGREVILLVSLMPVSSTGDVPNTSTSLLQHFAFTALTLVFDMTCAADFKRRRTSTGRLAQWTQPTAPFRTRAFDRGFYAVQYSPLALDFIDDLDVS